MTIYTVIGAGGFVGTHVVAHLRRAGIEPLLPERDDPRLWNRDLGRIFYCAGLTGDYRTRPFAAVEAHVGLLTRLIEHARYERIVYLSSTRLYDSQAGPIGHEDRPISINAANPEHLYEISKLLGENVTLHRSGGRGVVARLSYVFGWDDGAQGFLSDWLRRMRHERALVVDSSPDGARDYIHVDDVAAALRTLLDSQQNTIVNVARGETISNGRISALVARHGWTVSFQRQDGHAEGKRIDVNRLKMAGFEARPVPNLIEDYLGRLMPI